MTDSISAQQIRQALKEVRHPEIDNTLSNLGMLGDVSLSPSRCDGYSKKALCRSLMAFRQLWLRRTRRELSLAQ